MINRGPLKEESTKCLGARVKLKRAWKVTLRGVRDI